MGNFIKIYEGIKAFTVIDAGYKDYKDLSKDVKIVSDLISIITQQILVELDTIKTTLANYKSHPEWGKINERKQQMKIKELNIKLDTWAERLSYINNNKLDYFAPKLDRWIKAATAEIKRK